jgi:hypothetical protein
LIHPQTEEKYVSKIQVAEMESVRNVKGYFRLNTIKNKYVQRELNKYSVNIITDG